MKKIQLFTVILALAFVSCKKETTEVDSVTTDTATETEMTTTASDTAASPTGSEDTALYACSMHPDITGAKGEKCSKCGMDLTEPVAAN